MGKDYLRWIPVFKKQLELETHKAPEEKRSRAHGADHVSRVWKRAEKLAKKLGADMETLVAAAYLHDLGRHYGYEKHGKTSARLAKKVLQKTGFPKQKIPAALEAIASHDYSTKKSERKSLESKILYDSDKLDAFGKTGIRRHEKHYLSKCKTREEKKTTTKKILSMLDKRYQGLQLSESKKIGKKSFDEILAHFEKKLRKLEKSGKKKR